MTRASKPSIAPVISEQTQNYSNYLAASNDNIHQSGRRVYSVSVWDRATPPTSQGMAMNYEFIPTYMYCHYCERSAAFANLCYLLAGTMVSKELGSSYGARFQLCTVSGLKPISTGTSTVPVDRVMS